MSDNITVKDNIILFPKQKKESPKRQLSDKEMKIAMEAQARLFAQQLKDVAIDDLFALLDKNSLDTDNVNMQKDLAFIADAIKGLIYREFNIKHPMQVIVDNSVKVDIIEGIPTQPMVTYKNILVKKPSKKPKDDKEIP
jgi:hypothetical protein